MAHQNIKWKNEKGIALVVAVLITSALVAIGSFAMVMTNTELDISRNDKLGKQAFYVAEGAPAVLSHVIEEVFFEGEPTDIPDVYIKPDIFEQILHLDTALDYTGNAEDNRNDIVETAETDPDISFGYYGKKVDIDIDWRWRKSDYGTSIMRHEGYEATGIRNEVRVYFDCNSMGRSSNTTKADIHLIYKY